MFPCVGLKGIAQDIIAPLGAREYISRCYATDLKNTTVLLTSASSLSAKAVN